MSDHIENKEREAADARKALGLPPLRPSFPGKVVDMFIGRGDPCRECRVYRDKGCCFVDGISCDYPKCKMNMEHCAKSSVDSLSDESVSRLAKQIHRKLDDEMARWP